MDCNCNDVTQTTTNNNNNMMNTVMQKNGVSSLRSNVIFPTMLAFKGTIPAANVSTFFYFSDALGISSPSGLEVGGISMVATTGTSIAVVQNFLKTYACIVTCINQTVSDATQLQNSLQTYALNPDGNIATSTVWAPPAFYASNNQPNLLNVGQCFLFTFQTFMKFPIVSDALVSVITTLTLKGLRWVSYADLDAYLDASNLNCSGTSGGC